MGNKNVLIVEGPDDQHVVRNLLLDRGIPCLIPDDQTRIGNLTDIVIQRSDGIANLLSALPTNLKALSDLERIGVIVDADTDINRRWDELRNIMEQAGGINIPKHPDTTGTIVTIDQGYRKLNMGIWLMPNNVISGVLEDFIKQLVPEKDGYLLNLAVQTVDGIPEPERRFSANSKAKAHIHTWLAWQKDPGIRLGQAITTHYCNTNAPQAQQLIEWVQRLFNL